jgi:hypothetical protein
MNLKEMGLPVPSGILIDKAPIHNKKELKEAIQQVEKAQAQAEQQAQQLQLQNLATENETKLSFSHAQNALAAERMAKISEERAVNAERLQRADEERTASILNLLKAFKELDGLDIKHLAEKVQILNALGGEEKELSREKRNEKEQSSQEQSAQTPQV